MNAAQVLDHFDRISDAPDAIPRLRRFILDLAVRGKLVEQDPNDEPASELLKRIQAEKTRFGPETKHKKARILTEDERPFEIPDRWMWVRFGETVRVRTGKLDANAAIEGGAYPFFTCSQTPSQIDTYSFDTSAVLLAGNGDFNIKYYEGKFDAYQRTYVIEPLAWSLRFCFILVISQRKRITENNRGSAIPYLKLADITYPIVPLPPLAEQHRIVGKVDELMALCDRLEAAQAERESRRDKLAGASLHRLNNGANGDEIREYARFHLNHLPRIATRIEHIQQLRQTILNLAVRGKLVPQDHNDEPACELLKRIQAEKARLLKEGEAKPRKQQRPMTDAAEPFSIPESWRWISLDDIAFGFRYGTSVKCSYEPKGEPVLRIPNVANGRIDIEDLKYGLLSEREADDLRLRLDDILIVRSNGSLNLVGRPALVEAQAVGFCYAGYLVRLRTSTVHLDSYYLLLALNTSHVRDQIEIPIRTTVGLKNVNATELSGLTIPLPPVAEQHRIVRKVDELIALCDRLEARLTVNETESRRLLEAVLHQALNGTAE